MPTININAILVGVERFTDADKQEVQDGIELARTIFSQVGLGFDQVLFWQIPLDRANGYEDISGDSEADDLTADWTIENNGLDVFYVLTYAGPAISSSFPRLNGPCNKNAPGMTGVVLAIEEDLTVTGQGTAHEIAHYLGLRHKFTDDNLMFQSFPNGAKLEADQGDIMKRHCFVTN